MSGLRSLLRRVFCCPFGHHRITIDTDHALLACACVDCERTEVIGYVFWNATNARKPIPRRRKR